MDIQSSEFWLRSILVDLNLPQNQDRAVDFINWFAERYVLPIKFEYVHTDSTEKILISIGSVTQILQRTSKNLIFSIYTSEWKKIS